MLNIDKHEITGRVKESEFCFGINNDSLLELILISVRKVEFMFIKPKVNLVLTEPKFIVLKL